MKAILMSIKPKYVVNILNGKKTIEIRKTLPKCDLPIDVYIYCTKDKKFGYMHNGKSIRPQSVVAKFTLNKVEEIKGMFDELNREYAFENEKDLLDKSCLESDELGDYLKIYNNNDFEKVGYAWHIDNLVPFDKPKEISEFSIKVFPHRKDNLMTRYLTRAPESWCYVEV